MLTRIFFGPSSLSVSLIRRAGHVNVRQRATAKVTALTFAGVSLVKSDKLLGPFLNGVVIIRNEQALSNS